MSFQVLTAEEKLERRRQEEAARAARLRESEERRQMLAAAAAATVTSSDEASSSDKENAHHILERAQVRLGHVRIFNNSISGSESCWARSNVPRSRCYFPLGSAGRARPRGEADERVDPAGQVPRHPRPADGREGEEAVSALKILCRLPMLSS